MEKINLNLDSKRFPQIYMRYSPDKMWDLLIKMCQGLKIDITEANLYTMAANVERDLRHIVRGGKASRLHSRVLPSGSISRHAHFVYPGRAYRRASVRAPSKG
jgi:hypothetical protein